jgi:Fic family protein
MTYNWQQKDWPKFSYDLSVVEDGLFAFAEATGLVSGILNTLPKEQQIEAIITTMVAEAMKTSAIEGEYLGRPDVLSSIRKNFGLHTATHAKDKRAQGIGQLMVDVRKTYAATLTIEKLFAWHKMLMTGAKNISTGEWRTHKEPMQVISGSIGKEKIHFEAPPSSRVPKEMAAFIKWFNDTAPGGKKEIKKAPVRAAIAHLYFESIHPFEDGNGRIGRAIAEKAISQTLGRPVLLSLSKVIEADKNAYYTALKKAQRTNEISAWIKYFSDAVLTAQKQAKQLIEASLKKTKFFDRYKGELNERQLKLIKRMMDGEPEGFKGGINAAKYMSLVKVSKATATRDLQHLHEIGALTQEGGGRSTKYHLNIAR